jgi:hypothetical protein
MDAPRRSIFREEAIRRYQQRTTTPSTDPSLTSWGVVIALWLLLGLLLAAGAVCWIAFGAYR